MRRGAGLVVGFVQLIGVEVIAQEDKLIRRHGDDSTVLIKHIVEKHRHVAIAERTRGKAVIGAAADAYAVGMGDSAIEPVECDGCALGAVTGELRELLDLLSGAVLDIRRSVCGGFLKYCRVDTLGNVRPVYVIGAG